MDLKTYADIFSGYTLRNSGFSADNQLFRVISLRDVNSKTGQINYAALSTTQEFAGNERFILRNGDLLLATKGNDNTVVLFTQTDGYPVLATSVFTIIRPMRQFLDPAYLLWFL